MVPLLFVCLVKILKLLQGVIQRIIMQFVDIEMKESGVRAAIW